VRRACVQRRHRARLPDDRHGESVQSGHACDARLLPFYATFQNVLLGEVTFIDRRRHRIYTEPAVHRSGRSSGLSSNSAGTFTFYGRFVGQSGIDGREALPTAWAGVWAGNRTSIEYWRDPGVAVSPFPCGGSPFSLDERQVRAYDANGAVVPTTAGNPFPQAAGVTSAGTTLGLVNGFGWLFVNLNLPAPDGPQNDIRQSWITMRNIPRDQPATADGVRARHSTGQLDERRQPVKL
jgi:hypothetical protein